MEANLRIFTFSILWGKAFFTPRRIIFPIICLGIALRLVQYLSNRSLWLDESMLALNIVERSLIGLLQPLDNAQGAPIGFLMIQKVLVEVFGNNEYALRAFPFLSSMLSFYLFFKLLKKFNTSDRYLLIGLSLFALSSPLIYYSSEVKQYSTDVSIALILYLTAFGHLEKNEPTVGSSIFMGVIGAISVWLSHPAVFVFTGLGLTLISAYLMKKEWRKTIYFSVASSFVALNCAVLYFISLRNLASNKLLLNYWTNSFMPLPPLSLSDLKWFPQAALGIFPDPIGLPLAGLASLALVVGLRAVFLEQKGKFFILITPLLLTLLASGFRTYPFGGRMLLFLAPIILLLISLGTCHIIDRFWPDAPIVAVVFLILLFLHPIDAVAKNFGLPENAEEIKPVMNYISEKRQNGDMIYVYYGSEMPFKYYSKKHGLNDRDHIIGTASRDNWKNYFEDLEGLRGAQRAWVLFSHVYRGGGIDEEKFFLFHLDSMGTRLDSFKSVGAAVYLYNLAVPEAAQAGLSAGAMK